MHGMIKNHIENNPAWLITRGCGTAVEFLSFFGENYLYEEVIKKIDFRIKGTPYMLKVVIWSISGANPQNFYTCSKPSVMCSQPSHNLFKFARCWKNVKKQFWKRSLSFNLPSNRALHFVVRLFLRQPLFSPRFWGFP